MLNFRPALAIAAFAGAVVQSTAVNCQESAEPVPSIESLSTSDSKKKTILSGQELHRWERYLRGFRREHNFALTAGASSGRWQVDRLGTIEDRNFDNSGLFTRFQYSFHLPIWRGFGYLLGSSVGYHFEATDKRRSFKPAPAVMFPGILTGLTINFSPIFRLTGALDFYLERHENIEERDGVDEDVEISVSMRAFDAGAYLDIFYDLGWAIRVESHYRQLAYLKPEDAVGHPVDAKLSKTDQWLGIGLLHHLL